MLSWTIAGVGGPGFAQVDPLGENNLGEVVGTYTATDGSTQAFLDDGGQLTGLGTLPGYADAVAYGINDLGQIVGDCSNPGGGSTGFVDVGGVMTPTVAGGATTAINDAGEQVGFAPDPALGNSSQAYYSSGGTTNFVVPSGAASGAATGVNANGQIIGDFTTASGEKLAFFDPNGISTVLPGSGVDLALSATGLNDFGAIVGSQGAFMDSFGFLITGTTETGIPPIAPGFEFTSLATPQAINDAGQVVGTAGTGGPGLPNDAFLYQGGTTTDLNTFLASGSGWVLSDASAINQLGQIVGQGTLNGVTEGFLLTPPNPPTKLVVATPPPSTVATGESFSLAVDVEDAAGDLDANDDGPVSVSVADPVAGGPGLIGGTITLYASKGVATFNGLGITGAGSVTLSASAYGLTSTSAGPIAVLPVHSVAFQSPTSGADIPIGTPFDATVEALDASGQLVAGYDGPVTVATKTISLLGDVLTPLATVNAVGGVATFTGLSLSTPGPTILAAYIFGSPSIESDEPINLTAVPTALTVLSPTAEATIEADLPFNVEVAALDAAGDTDYAFNGPIYQEVGAGAASKLTEVGEFVEGVAEFPLTLPTSGLQTVTFAAYATGTAPTGTVITTSTSLTVSGEAPADFFGDGKSDLGVFGYGRYLVAEPGTADVINQPFGGPDDIPVVGDFFGDGKSDLGVFGYGRFLIAEPGTNKVIDQPLGGPDDVPVIGDFFGNGHDDLGVYGYGRFFILDPSTGKTIDQPFGGPDDVPVIGDFFGDGKDDLGVYGYGRFLVAEPGTSKVIDQPFGGPQDIPVVGDYFGDGTSDFGVYGYGRFLIAEPGTGKVIDQPFGGPDDAPVVGDFFGDGKDDLGVYGYGRYLIAEPGTSKVIDQSFGGPEDVPIDEAPVLLYPVPQITTASVAESPAIAVEPAQTTAQAIASAPITSTRKVPASTRYPKTGPSRSAHPRVVVQIGDATRIQGPFWDWGHADKEKSG